MGFVNEYISNEDIEKYKLKEAVYRFNPALRAFGLPENWCPMWTIDKERHIFLGKCELEERSLAIR